MQSHEQHSDGFSSDRFARLDALYVEFCHQASREEEGAPAPSVIEVPCELAPGVRRRIRRVQQ
jgi:hypothetical protein